MHTFGMTLGQRFLRARKAKKIPQSELARLLGVTRNAVSMWERDESQPKSKTMQKAAVILEVGFDWLATGRGGLVEATVKRIRKGKGGLELWPESDDPRYQERVPLKPAKGEAEVVIRGLVIATYNPIPRGN